MEMALLMNLKSLATAQGEEESHRVYGWACKFELLNVGLIP
jgi:hypothetical protein